jgi:hypothetical protein
VHDDFLGGQIVQNVFFFTAQHKGRHSIPEDGQGLIVLFLLYGLGKTVKKVFSSSQESGIEKAELGPELHGIIFQRGSCQGQTVSAFQGTDGLEDTGPRIFDVMGLIEDDVVKNIFQKEVYIVPQGMITHDDQVILFKMGSFDDPSGPGMPLIGQAGGKLLDLTLPVGQGDDRGHQEAGLQTLCLLQVLQETQGLQGLAQSHIIGQTAVAVVMMQTPRVW